MYVIYVQEGSNTSRPRHGIEMLYISTGGLDYRFIPLELDLL